MHDQLKKENRNQLQQTVNTLYYVCAVEVANRAGRLIHTKYYTYMLRSDPQHAQLADRDYQRKLRLLKTDYSTKADYMRSDVRVYNVMSDR